MIRDAQHNLKQQHDASLQQLHLLEALELRAGQLPNWRRCLDYMMQLLQAHKVTLSSRGTNDIGFIEPLELNADQLTHANIKPNTHQLKQTLIQTDKLTLLLSLPSEQWLKPIVGFLRQLLILGERHAQSVFQQQLNETFMEALQWQQLSLSLHGDVAESVVKHSVWGQLLSQKHKRVQLRGAPHWLAEVLERCRLNPEPAQLYHRPCTLNSDTLVMVSLWYQPSEYNGGSHIRLLCTPLKHQGDATWLCDAFALKHAQAEVAHYFAQGNPAKCVADKTGYSVHTVYSYIKDLYAHLGVNSQSQLTAALSSYQL